MNEINYPKSTTYFIASDGVNYSHGVIDTDQCMTTGFENIEVFDDETLYQNRLIELGLSNNLCVIDTE